MESNIFEQNLPFHTYSPRRPSGDASEGIGSTSFTLSFGVRVGDQVRSTGRTVYVVVSTDGSGKRPMPPKLRAGLESALTEAGR